MGAAPDFQRAHCPYNLSARGVSFVVYDFIVRVFPGLLINHWLSLCGHTVPQGFQQCLQDIPDSSNCDSKLVVMHTDFLFFSIHGCQAREVLLPLGAVTAVTPVWTVPLGAATTVTPAWTVPLGAAMSVTPAWTAPLGVAMTVTPAWMCLWARLRPSPQRKLED